MSASTLAHRPTAVSHATAARYPVRVAIGLLVAAGACCAVLLIAVSAMLGIAFGSPTVDEGVGRSSSSAAVAGIPRLYLSLYERAGARYGLDWAILAGIGKVECDHGRDPDPSCTKEGAVNSAGAGGPAQFLASTWTQYGVDGNGDGVPDRWDPADAIFGMANYLRASGAPDDYRKAIFAYNHAGWYVEEVEHWASLYRGSLSSPSSPSSSAPSEATTGGSTAPVVFTAGERAQLSPTDGHVALIPSQAPGVVRAMVMAGNELQDLPYGAGGHPDPRGALSEDCSSTVNYVLYRSGVRPISEIVRDNPLAQDYVDWGAPGPGRWVTIYSTTAPTDHVFVVIAGLRLDTSHSGTDVGPNRDEDGPRWRILDRIPTWARWSVRHPPGL